MKITRVLTLRIKMNKKNFRRYINEVRASIKNVRYNENNVLFTISEQSYKTIKDYPHTIINDYRFVTIKHKILQNIGVVIGLFMFLLYLYVRSSTVTNIHFAVDTDKNNNIKTYLEDKLVNIVGMKFLKNDLIDINLELRKEYSYFEWISVRKVGTVLVVDNITSNINVPNEIVNEGVGDFVAEKSGIIKFFKIKEGVPLINYNQYVKKGDLLVSGDLFIKRDFGDEYLYIYPEGYVIAEVWNYEEFEVKKEVLEKIHTGNIHSENEYSFFGIKLTFNKFKDKYKEYEVVEEEKELKVFNRNIGLFSQKKIYYYQLSDIIKEYNKEDADKYCRTSIIKKFQEETKYDDEVIISINIIDFEETEESFKIRYLVIKNENIAEFKRRVIDE